MKTYRTIQIRFTLLLAAVSLVPWIFLIILTSGAQAVPSTAVIPASSYWLFAVWGGIAVALAAFLVLRSLFNRVQNLTQSIQSLGQGNLNLELNPATSDEFDAPTEALVLLRDYLKNTSSNLNKISQGSLNIDVPIYSASDELNSALHSALQVISGQNQRVAQISSALSTSINELIDSSASTSEATTQIARTIEDVSKGAVRQSESIHQTALNVKEMSRLVAEVSKSLVSQGTAIHSALSITESYNQAVQKVAGHTSQVDGESAEMKDLAQMGVRSVDETVTSMQTIHSSVSSLAGKVNEMGTRSEQINDILKTIDEIASETNMLAINAAIEAARSAAQAEKVIDNLLNEHMITEAQLVNQILLANSEFGPSFWSDVCHTASLDAIFITDPDGVVVYTNEAGAVGWRFPDNPAEQAFVFRKLLTMTEGAICQVPTLRSLDHQMFKFVGVPRRDQRGIIQVGFNMRSLSSFSLQIGGFAVVASEVNRLADQAKTATREIGGLVRAIQKTVSEAQNAMHASAQEVENGVVKANNAGESLTRIRSAAESVYLQTQEVSKMVISMKEASGQLSEAMNFASQIVSQNALSVKQITDGYDTVEQAMENIASISEENSAASEEVSASTLEMNSQIGMLKNSTANLQVLVAELSESISGPSGSTHKSSQAPVHHRQPAWAH